MTKDTDTARKAIDLALGRIFRILSRPHQDGDLEDYRRCSDVIFDNYEAAFGHTVDLADRSPNWVRDRLRGAQGD